MATLRRSRAGSLLPLLLAGTVLGTAGPAWAAPAPAAGLGARPGDGLVELHWTGGGPAGVLVRELDGPTPPATPTDGREVFRGLASLVRDVGLTDGAAYSYAVWSLDSDGTTSDVPLTVTSTPVAAPASRLTLAATPAVVPTGSAIAFTGSLQAGGAPLPGEQVSLEATTGTGTSLVATATSAADGTVAFQVLPRVTAGYVARWGGGSFGQGVSSPTVTVAVQPVVTAGMAPGSLPLGGTAVLRGTVTPAYAGARVRVDRLLPSGWRPVALIGTAAGGGFALPVRPGVRGTVVLRAVLVGTAAYQEATSPAATLTVGARELRPGDLGGDVADLQRALLAVRMDLGGVDGSYSADTLHAVTAFQKLRGLPRTGIADAATLSALAGARPVSVRFPAPGLAVEIDLTRQVLLVSHAGVLDRVLDTSTGSNRLYVSDGVTYRATTPLGRFVIERKYNGVQVSRLGELYRPAYFVQGWAIHGSPSVPAYPASHGCVRLTDSAQDRLWPILDIGTPVTVYGG